MMLHQAINWSTLSSVLKFNVSLRNPGNTSVTSTGVVFLALAAVLAVGLAIPKK